MENTKLNEDVRKSDLLPVPKDRKMSEKIVQWDFAPKGIVIDVEINGQTYTGTLREVKSEEKY